MELDKEEVGRRRLHGGLFAALLRIGYNLHTGGVANHARAQ